MINVNVSVIGSCIDALISLIDEYEEIQLNIFGELKDSCINWQDGKSLEFENKIYLEKKESALTLQSLKDKKEIYSYIYNRYSEIGKKIVCNLNKKNTLLQIIDNCYNEANNIINEFNKIDRSFWYDEQYMISEQKQKVVNAANYIGEIKKNITNLYTKIENIEKEVNKKIKELENIKINDFEFNLL